MKKSILSFLMLATLATPVLASSPLPVLTVYKSPTCGCCEKWVQHMRASGFSVVSHDTENVVVHKARLGVPVAMGSCHTAEVDGYLLEGHVPAADVKRLLTERPRARGLVSPAMPASAPGMDDPRKTPYAIFLVDSSGSTTIYARH